MKIYNIKYRQRVENGNYHYWGFIDNVWIEPRKNWGSIGNSEQWSGLCDKNGKEIYVNDIIKYWDNQTSLIVFENGSFVSKDDIYESEGCGGSLWVNKEHIEKDCEVIGNIGDVFYPKEKKTKSKKR